ncbi:orotidine-5'-phosphate decarboxylase [Marivirga lumbricoides]|uniref:Orotidine 5'-phosphate decarboxylase n=1 Tax=Marivirga lumbricoides TaxID=1046115 RepID=A0A2T4DV88_9BACT|nr:orotidine-5'-phosphate decarboxylase [Marivirga lumbricoides]
MHYKELSQQIFKKSSYLCVGLDSALDKIPSHLLKEKDPIFEFNKQIIDATIDFAVAYKPNIAFYEALGPSGWETLQKTIDYLPKDVFTIADAKRGDIGNTSQMYAKAFFESLNFDSVTVAPYMGSDSVKPFLTFEEKWVILLALTSNEGAQDFQFEKLQNGKPLYEKVIEQSQNWGSHENMMYVIGATRNEQFAHIRQLIPKHFLLVPGVGAQGGSLKEISEIGLNKDGGLLVNSSRGIIYASSEKDFAKAAAQEARVLQEEMKVYLDQL